MKTAVYGGVLPNGFDGEFTGLSLEQIYSEVRAYALLFQRLGFFGVFTYDHLSPQKPEGGISDVSLECWTLLAAIAAETEDILIGPLVSCNGFRNPLLVLKMANTIDLISSGRFVLGLGGGWYEQEFRSFGFEYPAASVRLSQLREALQLIRTVWTKSADEFVGQFYRVNLGSIQPRRRLPLIVGGVGEQITLRLVAMYADYANMTGSPAEISYRIGLIRKYCDLIGRDFNEITITLHVRNCSIADSLAVARSVFHPGELERPYTTSLVGTLSMVEEQLAAYRAVGVEGFIVRFVNKESLMAFAGKFVPH